MFLFLFLGQDMETDTEVNRRSIYDRLDDLAQSPPPVFESEDGGGGGDTHILQNLPETCKTLQIPAKICRNLQNPPF